MCVPTRLVQCLNTISRMAAAFFYAVALAIVRMRLVDRTLDCTKHQIVYVARLLATFAYEWTTELGWLNLERFSKVRDFDPYLSGLIP